MQPQPMNRFRILAVLAIITTVFATLVLRAPAQSRPDCRTTLRPDTLVVGPDILAVTWSFSETMDDVLHIVPAEDSGLRVTGFRIEKATVKIATVNGVPGDWSIVFYDRADKRCTGQVHVRMPL